MKRKEKKQINRALGVRRRRTEDESMGLSLATLVRYAFLVNNLRSQRLLTYSVYWLMLNVVVVLLTAALCAEDVAVRD
jgi:hypothetical protein